MSQEELTSLFGFAISSTVSTLKTSRKSRKSAEAIFFFSGTQCTRCLQDVPEKKVADILHYYFFSDTYLFQDNLPNY